MTRSSSAGTDSVGRFLSHQHFRHPETGRIYGHVLRAFQSSVIECSTGALSVSSLQEWLREKRRVWPLHMVCHRARLVERFLEWSQAHGVIATNAFAELHGPTGRGRHRLCARWSATTPRRHCGSYALRRGLGAPSEK